MICANCRHPVDRTAGSAGPPAQCPNCGAALGVAAAEFSPRAFQAPPASPLVQRAPGTGGDGLAIASLVCGLLLFVPIIPQLLAVIFGTSVLLGRRRRSVSPSGRGFAVAGLVCGLAFAVLWTVVIVWLVASLRWSVATVSGGASARVFEAETYVAPPDEAEEKLNIVSQAIALYRKNFQRLPENLTDLVPDYLSSADLTLTGSDSDQRSEFLRLVGGVDPAREPATTILIYTDPFDRDSENRPIDPPRQLILQLDGKIRLLEVGEVRRRLALERKRRGQ